MMTQEDMNKHKERICDGLEMYLEKLEKIGKEKKEWSLRELGEVSDIVKDMAEAYKDLAKAHYYLSERSIEKY